MASSTSQTLGGVVSRLKASPSVTPTTSSPARKRAAARRISSRYPGCGHSASTGCDSEAAPEICSPCACLDPEHTMPDLLLTHGYFLEEDEKEREIMKPYPPLGLLSVSAFLRRAGFDVEIFDTTFSH